MHGNLSLGTTSLIFKQNMNQEILIPPEYKELSGPSIFLAGPIQGAPDWQAEAIEILKKISSVVHITSPRRPARALGEFSEKDYHGQVEWEHHYLDYAAEHGVILFWLAKEAEQIAGRAYAQTTRFELGEAIARHYLKGIKVVVGIEKGFSNERYLRKTIKEKAPNVPMLNTLEDTCRVAVKTISAI